MDWTFLFLTVSERMGWDSVLDSDNAALLQLSLTSSLMCILRFPQRAEFSVLSGAGSCEGLEASPQGHNQRGWEGESIFNIN